MKIYYVEALTGFGDIEQFYLVDFEFGFLTEFSIEGTNANTYESLSDFFACWDRADSFKGLCPKRGKKAFEECAVMVQVV